MSRALSRTKIGVAASAAFVGGLVVASAFNATPFGYAQQSATANKPSSQTVQPVADMNNAFVSIAEHVTPAVVSISTEHLARGGGARRPRSGAQVPPGLEDLFDQFDQRRNAPVEGSGSGFIVSPDGYILTNNHVVADADKVTVGLLDKRTYPAKVIGRDPTTDVAVIKIEGNNFPTASLGNDESSRVGEWVLAIGNPLQLDFTVTAGIISAKGRNAGLSQLYADPQYAIVDYIQTDAAINPGNSGGPLVNIRGEVIGINSAIASPTGYNAGYGFAIPVTLAKSVMNDLIKNGRVRRAVLGISIRDVRAEDAQVAGLKDIRGAKVDGFNPPDNSPAKSAGLEPGDIIVSIAGKPVERVATLQRIVRGYAPGDVLEVGVMRYGKSMTFKIKLAEAPSETQVASAEDALNDKRAPSYDRIGLSVEPISPERARQADLSESQRGLIVTDVDVAGPAYRQVFAGNIVLEVLAPGQRRAVHASADLEQTLARAKPGDVVSLLMYDPRPPKQTFVVNLKVEGSR